MRKEMNEFPVVLVINCGSSSIKFSVLDASDCEVLMSGIADGINSENAFLSVNGGEPAPLAHHSYEGALKAIAFELEKRNLNDSVALIGHRIAHGGSIFTESAIITDEVIDNIRRVSPPARGLRFQYECLPSPFPTIPWWLASLQRGKIHRLHTVYSYVE
jgi:propionate kinase